MTNAKLRNRVWAIRLPLLALALLAALLTLLPGGDTARAFTLGERLSDFEIDLDSQNTNPEGMWSNGETVWVVDRDDDQLYAYKMNPDGSGHGDRDSDKDITLHSSNVGGRDAWSDGATIWVSDNSEDKLFAYTLSNGNRDTSKEFGLHSDNGGSVGIWSDGTTIWVLDVTDTYVYAYALSDGTRQNGTGATTNREFDLASGNGTPRGIWSDGITMWVADDNSDKMFAYTLLSGARDTSRDFDLHSNNANPRGVWSDGRTMWVADTSDEKLFAYVNQIPQPFTRGGRLSNFEIALDSGNTWAYGVWSNGETVWVLDFNEKKFFAYEMDPEGSGHGDRDSSKDISLHSTNQNPQGAWSDGTTIWVADNSDNKLFAYTLSNGNRDTSKEFDLDNMNNSAWGIWSDGTTIWVGDFVDDEVYAYALSDGTRQDGTDGTTDREFDLHSDNGSPRGIWSDGATIWVGDSIDDKLFAYTLSNGNRDTSREFDLTGINQTPHGIWSDGATMWVADLDDNYLYAYDLTRANIYLSIPRSSEWKGVAGTYSHLYLSNNFNPDKIWVYVRADNSRTSFETHADNRNVRGLWTDGTHVWAVQNNSTTLHAYRLSDESYASGENFSLASGNDDPVDIWGDDWKLYVLDETDHEVYAYRRSDGQRISGEGFSLHSDNGDPIGISSDGVTMWVADNVDDKVYAYTLSNGDRDTDREFDLHDENDRPGGIWSDGSYLHVIEDAHTIPTPTLYRYNISDLVQEPTRRVTLALSQRSISENGGTATVTATLSNASTEATTITVSESSSAVTQTGTTLSIAAGQTTSAGSVTLTGVDDDVFTGSRFVTVVGTAVNTAGVEGPADLRLVVLEDETVALETFESDSDLDFDLADSATDSEDNGSPVGVWSDGATIWVADSADDKVYAYTLSNGNRDTAKEFDLHAGNSDPYGMWSDGATMWVGDWGDDKLFAYTLSTGNRDTAKEFNLHSNNDTTVGIWSDGVTVWVSDTNATKLFAYALSDGTRQDGTGGTTDREIDLHSDNVRPRSVWSDGATIWVFNSVLAPSDRTLFAYTLSNGNRDTSKEFDLHSDNGAPAGAWCDGANMWVADLANDKVFAYNSATPTVTLALSQRGISENGGTATVTAKLDKASTEATTITVSESSDAVTLTGTTLTIAASATTSTGSVTLTGVDDDVFTGSRFVTVSGTAVNTDGVLGPADVRLVVLEDETVVAAGTFKWDSDLDFDLADSATDSEDNGDPTSIWSDGATVWVADRDDDKLYAYKMDPEGSTHGDRDSSGDITLADSATAAEDNGFPTGIWSDGATVWVADFEDNKLYAYTLSNGNRATDLEFDLHADNTSPEGIWSDGVTIWVADSGNDKLFAYNMSPGGSGHGDRDSSKEITLADSATPAEDNGAPRGIWSDGATIWVVDLEDEKLYAYTLSNGNRDSSKEITLADSATASEDNGTPTGVWSDGATIWVADFGDDKVFAYNSPAPTVSLALSQRGISENGGTATVTATLSAASTEATTITVSESSSAVTQTGTTLTIAASATTSTGSVVLTGVDDDVFTGSRFVTVSGTAVNTDGVEGPADVRLVVLENETVAVEDMVHTSDLDFNGLNAATNNSPTGIWSDGVTLWVSDFVDEKLYAYRMNPGGADHGDRDSAKEFNLAANNHNPRGLWSDGETLWTLDSTDNKLYAYRMNPGEADHGNRVEAHEFNLDAGNDAAAGIWSDGVTLWVSDSFDDKLFAYTMDPGGSGHGDRVSTRDITLADSNTAAEDNGAAYGIWSDGTTMWVADTTDNKLYAYNVSTRARAPGKELTPSVGVTPSMRGIWSDGTTLWFSNNAGGDDANDKVYALGMRRTFEPLPPRSGPDVNLWPVKGTATLTAKDLSGAFGCSSPISGRECSDTGILSDDDFSYGATPYTIVLISVETGGVLRIGFDRDPAAQLGSATLHVGSNRFAFSDGDLNAGDPNEILWSSTGLSWSANDEIELKITVPCGRGGQLYRLPYGGTRKHFSLGCMNSYDGGNGADVCGLGDFIALGAFPVPADGQNAPENPPAAPENLAATPGSDAVVLTWDAVTGATGYSVQRRNEDESEYAEIGTSTTNSYTDATAEVAQGYAYRVEAVNDAGSSDPSTHVLAIILPPPPPAPTGLSATSVASDEVTLSWTAPDDDYVTQYIVLRAVRDADPPAQPSLVAHVGAETTEVTDGNVEAGTAYRYSVIAINPGGESAPATLDVDTPAQSSESNSGPAAPTGLSATRSGLTVSLAWDAVDDITSYNVLRQGPGETEHTQLATVTANSHTDTPPGSGTYSYQVQAVDDEGAGPASDAATEDIPPPPDPPTNLQAAATHDTVTLTWTAPSQTLSGYLIYRKVRDADPPEEFSAHGFAEADANSHTDTLVEADTAYAYHVVSVSLTGESEPSAEVEVDTLGPGPLSGFTLVDASDQSALATLTAGTSVELDDPGGGSYGIRADLANGESAGSVRLELSGPKTVSRTENHAPYSLYGDRRSGGDRLLNGQSLPAGSYTLTATAYAETNLGGDALGTLEVSFTVTQANRAPAFGSATYSFSIAEDASSGDAVGSVSATDADDDTLTYTIESGNGDGKFTMNRSSGAITTAGTLDHETDASYTLTVKADDGNGGTATATVNVTVTDVAESSPGPLAGFTLVDASDQSVLATLTAGASVALADPSGGSYAIRADVDSNASIGSVKLELSGAKTVTKTENYAPYSLYGDRRSGGDKLLNGQSLPAGSYTLRATAYSERAGGGDVLGTLEVSFTVTAQ